MATDPVICSSTVPREIIGSSPVMPRNGARNSTRSVLGGAFGHAKGLPPMRRGGNAGFTLLEMLIAFAIASIALAVLYRGATDGLLGSRLAARTDEAVARARSRLAVLCHGPPLMPGEQSGDDGSGYTWRTQINRAATETVARAGEDQSSAPLRADLFAVRVTMLWPGTARPHQVSLETRCLSVGAADRP